VEEEIFWVAVVSERGLKCVESCAAVVSDEVHGATVGAAAECSEICFTTSICGVAQTTDGK
jgi:hypothetical protein